MLVLWSHEYWVNVKDNLPGPLLLGIKSRGNSSAWTKPALRPVFSVCLCGKKNLTSELFSCESWAGSKVGWSWWKDSCCLQRICDGYFALSRKGSSPSAPFIVKWLLLQWKAQLKAKVRLLSVPFSGSMLKLWSICELPLMQSRSDWLTLKLLVELGNQQTSPSHCCTPVLFLLHHLLSPLAVGNPPQILWLSVFPRRSQVVGSVLRCDV